MPRSRQGCYIRGKLVEDAIVARRSVQKDCVAQQSHDAPYIPTLTVHGNESIGMLIGGKTLSGARLDRGRQTAKNEAGNEQRRIDGCEQRDTRHNAQYSRDNARTGTAHTLYRRQRGHIGTSVWDNGNV
jgi:hypothetical protein